MITKIRGIRLDLNSSAGEERMPIDPQLWTLISITLTTTTIQDNSKYLKSEKLGSVYNSIVLRGTLPGIFHRNKTHNIMPWIWENARELHNTIAQIGGLETDGLFRKKSAYSERWYRGASYIGSKWPPQALLGIWYRGVQNGDRAAEIRSFLPDLATTRHHHLFFLILRSTIWTQFQFNMLAGDTNRQIMERLSHLIQQHGYRCLADVTDPRYFAAVWPRMLLVHRAASLSFSGSAMIACKTSGVY